ncbi:MAG: general secretion pathway protein GspB [Desulfobacterales bacterium]
MSSILNALKKLEDDTAEQGDGHSPSPVPATKQVLRKGIRKNRVRGMLLPACLGMTVLAGLIWFLADRNPAPVPNLSGSQSENRIAEDSETKRTEPESLKSVLEPGSLADREKEANQSEKQGEVPVSEPVPVPPAPADIQEHMAKFQEMAENQSKKEEKNDPFRMPDAFGELLSIAAEKNTDRTDSETAKPDRRAGRAVPVPLLPEPKNPVKTESVPLLPAPKNPVKTEAAVPAPRPLPVPDMKKVQDARMAAVQGEPEPEKSSAASEPVNRAAGSEPAKVSAQPEPVKETSEPAPAKPPLPSEQVKVSAPSKQEDYSSVSEKTAGETGLSIQALVWSEDPAERMAVINGSIVREKGTVADVYVVHIGIDRVVFQKENAQWMQKFRLN